MCCGVCKQQLKERRESSAQRGTSVHYIQQLKEFILLLCATSSTTIQTLLSLQMKTFTRILEVNGRGELKVFHSRKHVMQLDILQNVHPIGLVVCQPFWRLMLRSVHVETCFSMFCYLVARRRHRRQIRTLGRMKGGSDNVILFRMSAIWSRSVTWADLNEVKT